jgi:hypothetical protein
MNGAALIDDGAGIRRRTHTTGPDGMRVVRDVLADEAQEPRRGREPSWSSCDHIGERPLPRQIVNEANAFDKRARIVLVGIGQHGQIDDRSVTGITTCETKATARSRAHAKGEHAKGRFAVAFDLIRHDVSLW